MKEPSQLMVIRVLEKRNFTMIGNVKKSIHSIYHAVRPLMSQQLLSMADARW